MKLKLGVDCEGDLWCLLPLMPVRTRQIVMDLGGFATT